MVRYDPNYGNNGNTRYDRFLRHLRQGAWGSLPAGRKPVQRLSCSVVYGDFASGLPPWSASQGKANCSARSPLRRGGDARL